MYKNEDEFVNGQKVKLALIIIGLLAVLLFGCDVVGTYDLHNKVGELSSKNSDPRGIYEFRFREHQYLQFGSGNNQTIVHDPDCGHIKHVTK